MELDLMAHAAPLRSVATLARRAEEAGFGTMWITESGRTAYLSCAAAALATERMGLGTGVAVAFPRSPMVTASVAWELAETTGGRFTVGLGTQVRAHIERRYSSEYAPPGPRMKEYVQAMQAIFAAFRGEAKLDFHGDYYDFSLLPAQWSPGPIDAPDPPIFVSAVLPWMSRMAGEICDGVHIHPFHSPEYVTDRQLPHIAEGAERGGRTLEDVCLEIPIMTAVGEDDQEIAASREHARMMVGFYGSTRTYAPVFEQHGFEGLSEQLHAAQREGDLGRMAEIVTDDVLDHYIVSGTWSEMGPELVTRYEGLAPNLRIMSYTAVGQYREDPDVFAKWADVAAAMRAS
ncbi:MAG: TIGR03617 family F420-dependent LLM class oxidoreductase [Acidimicrobiia bacterium]|nr:TIGR03617 family F420-dependent LLM class oxidoreductase [Acidimicrobiia bacterium]